MGEYEESYPEAYGRREETAPHRRHFLGFGPPRQVRDAEPSIAEARSDAASVEVVNINAADTASRARPPQPVRHVERPRRPLVQRTPQEIRDDIAQQLAESPFIDESDIAITVDGAEVTLAGTINSLIAISLAQALASNVPGVSRVQVRLRVRPAPRRYETAGASVYKIEGE
jgi:osmotically-inducible protein OsmY